MAYAVHSFFQENGFVYVNTPLISASDCEGAGAQFQVTTLDLENVPKTEDGKVDYSKDFFGKMTNLTVSGQLEGETYATAMKNIYTFGPTFRAENSNTARHLAEFWMIEPEMAFCTLEGDMEWAEKFLKYIFSTVLEKNAEDMEFFSKFVLDGVVDTLRHVIDSPFQHMTYTDAIKVLEPENDRFEFPKTLNIRELMCEDSEDLWYNLVGVVLHAGTAQGGHYTSLIRLNKKWMLELRRFVKKAVKTNQKLIH